MAASDRWHRGLATALVLGLSLGLVGGAAAAAHTHLRSADRETFSFESYEALSWASIVNQRVTGHRTVRIGGHVLLPPGAQGRSPVMVIMHGSGGLGGREHDYARALNREGIGAAILDSFTPRGVATTAGQQERVTSLTMLGDVYGLLNRLARHPRIDPARIGLMGFSKGGAVTLLAADDHMRRALAQAGNRFAVHVAFYPSCVIQVSVPRPTGAPLLMLLGGLDSYTPAAQCQRYIEKMRAAGFPVRSITYRNAHHAWDAFSPVQRSMIDYSYGGCTVDLDEAGGVTELTSGLSVDSPAAARKALEICGTPGVILGRNEAAARQSLEDLKAFVKEVLGH